jgi:Holliday junction resolvasome RuvABC DNA-binding subunit
VAAIRRSSAEELTEVRGIGRSMAERILRELASAEAGS